MNPTEEVKVIIQESGWIRWITAYFRDEEQIRGMTLKDVVQTLREVKSWDSMAILAAIKTHKVKNLLSGKQIETQTRSVLCDGELAKLNEFADVIAARDSLIWEIYSKLKVIAVRWSEETQGTYAERRIGCLFAARLLASKKAAIYFKLDTGNGKTQIQLLYCQYLLENTSKRPVIVTLNPILKRQTILIA